MSFVLAERLIRISTVLGLLVLAALVLPGTTEASSFNQIKKLLASDAAAGDQFGSSVALSGDTIVVGATFENAGGDRAGAAYVFQRDRGGADNWGEVKKLTPSDLGPFDAFGENVAVSDDTIVVGSPGSAGLGAAYVFERNAGGADNWGEVAKLTASDAESSDFFGRSVAISGDTLIAGAPAEDSGGIEAGAAYVFERNAGGTNNWGEVRKLNASDADALDNFGSVALSGDTVVVGASHEGANAGAAYIFQRDHGGAGNWGEVKKLTASDAAPLDFFSSVGLDGDTAVIGAHGNDASGSAAGAAYVFQRDHGGADNWGEVKKLAASDIEPFDHFGTSTAISGDTVLVATPFEGAGGPFAGALYVFERNAGGPENWGEIKKVIASDAAPDDGFGGNVAVSGDTAVVGASDEDAGGSAAGAAYVFQEGAVAPPPVGGLSLPPDVGGSGATSSFWWLASVTAAALLVVTAGGWLVARRRA